MLNAKALLEWMEHHNESAVFENKLLSSLKECTDKARSATGKFNCDRIWTAYHFLRTSDMYVCDWESILLKAGVREISVICYQYIGDQILKKLIKTTYPLTAREAESSLANCELTYEETNAVRYVAGYVVQSLQKKILKSTHAQRDDIKLCLSQLVHADDEAADDSQDWMNAVDRGGLMHVNNDTYELFLSMESKKLYQVTKSTYFYQTSDEQHQPDCKCAIFLVSH